MTFLFCYRIQLWEFFLDKKGNYYSTKLLKYMLLNITGKTIDLQISVSSWALNIGKLAKITSEHCVGFGDLQLVGHRGYRLLHP